MKNILRSIKLLYKVAPLLMVLLGLLTAMSLFVSPLYSLIDKYLFDRIQLGHYGGIDKVDILYIVSLYFVYNLSIFLIFKLKDVVYTYSQGVINSYLQKKQ